MVQLGQGVGAEVGQRMALEPGPEILDRIELGSIRGQRFDLEMTLGRVHIVAYQATAVGFGAVPNDEQRPAVVGFERLEEFDDFFLAHRAFVKSKAHAAEMHSSDNRDVIPIEAELHHRAVTPERPSANSRGALRQTRLVDEND